MSVLPSPRRPRNSLLDWLTSNALLYGLLAIAGSAFLAAVALVGVWAHEAWKGDAPALSDAQAAAAPTLALPPPWDGKERVNVLLLGVDDRPWDANWGPPRADAIILLTLDPRTMTAGAISLPRELWVKLDLPELPSGKINQAYSFGEAEYGPGGGARLTAQVVGRLLQIKVHHYVVVNFRAFITFVDAIHGVHIDVPQRMALDVFTADGKRYDYPLYPGRQVLSGALALAYARNRSVGQDGDFGRIRRQQQVLEAVLQRLKNPRVLAELTVKAPFLAKAMADNLQTDLSVTDALRLARLATQVPRQNIRLALITQKEAPASMQWERGQQVYALVPNEEAILAVRDRVFAPPPPTPTPAPQATATPAATATRAQATLSPTPLPPTPTPPLGVSQALAEHPTLLVENGTTTAHLACRTARWLRSQGFDSVEIGNAADRYANSLLLVYADRPQTVAFLQAWLHLPDDRLRFLSAEAPPADLVLILGDDWAQAHAVDGVSCNP